MIGFNTTRARPLSLLVVEDNYDAAESLAVVLRNSGYNVSIAYDGMQAIRMIDVSAYNVILCDIGLPGCSGYEVAAHVRRLRGDEPLVVAVSAYSQDSVKENARAAGFDNFSCKPADPLELEQFLRDRAGGRCDTPKPT